MAKNMQPIAKRCRTLGISPAVMGYDKKNSKRSPKTTRRKKSEYGIQLNEKQKVKFIYGVLEKQFRRYYVMATKKPGMTGEVLLQILESRLDNVAFRLGFANTRRQARQMVSHRHVTVNGKIVNIPSYLVKPGDVISVAEKTRGTDHFKGIFEGNSKNTIVKWLDFDRNTLTAKVVALADRSDIDFEVAEHLIVELYSK